MEVILNINDLQYNNLWDSLSLSLEKGCFIAIAGSNNSGKSTLCRILDRKIIDNFNINLKGKDIKDYSLEEYNHSVQVVYPNECILVEETGEEELIRRNCLEERIEFFQKHKFLKTILSKEIEKMTIQEKIWLQMMIAVGKAEDLVVIDSIDSYLDKEDLKEAYTFLKACTKAFKISMIIMTLSLEATLLVDKLYIMKEGEMILEGDPLTILQKDNLINKAGLKVPFMIDLSVKLRDYDLIKEIELEKEKLVEALWN
ncbi:MAG: ATP-binding cassette domain-containing protein [Bacilli bacterium]|nr:ATP-binding cassette domain-containing protein [Bacilli bacterium]